VSVSLTARSNTRGGSERDDPHVDDVPFSSIVRTALTLPFSTCADRLARELGVSRFGHETLTDAGFGASTTGGGAITTGSVGTTGPAPR